MTWEESKAVNSDAGRGRRIADALTANLWETLTMIDSGIYSCIQRNFLLFHSWTYDWLLLLLSCYAELCVDA
jgi:hypothetical protein